MFDFECTQDTPLEGKVDSFIHKPNFCIAQQSCFKCIENVHIEQPCEVCGDREHMFKGEHTLREFMTYLTHLDYNFQT